jgi:hypothetical protein
MSVGGGGRCGSWNHDARGVYKGGVFVCLCTHPHGQVCVFVGVCEPTLTVRFVCLCTHPHKFVCLSVFVYTLTVRFVCLHPPSRSGLCVCVPTLTVRCEWVRAGGGAGMGQENKVLHKRNK